jgi:NAD(P)-dependent dehydrogenase (short-subunit alcohol dehydrogenase family)
MGSLTGRITLVAGATRGAGRGIATALGEAGATVYCTGRSSRATAPRDPKRPETIEETAERVTAAGGRGIAVQVDHTDEAQVAALGERIRADHGGLDLLVNDVWGGDVLMEFGVPVWKISIDRARRMFDSAVFTHLVNVRHLTPLLFGRERPLVVEVTDGDTFGYRGALVYDLVKMTVIRLAWDLSVELRPQGVTALSITPGFLRSEAMLDLFGVTEQTWQQAPSPHFAACSETPLYVGRAVAALAAEPNVAARNGRVFSSWGLAREYGFTDADGRRPMWDEHFERAYGRYPAADEAAFTSWEDGPFELSQGDGYPTSE